MYFCFIVEVSKKDETAGDEFRVMAKLGLPKALVS